MSRRSSRRSHGDQSGRARDGRQHRAAEVRQSAGYTLGHAGRQLRLRPIAFWIAVGTLVIIIPALIGGWYLVRKQVMEVAQERERLGLRG